MKKILHIITESWLLGGAQRNTLITIQGLKRKGYNVELACGPGGPMVDAALDSGIPVTIFDSMVREISPILDFRCLIENYKFLKQKRFDIVHTHSTKGGIITRFAAKLSGVPIIVHTIHGTPFQWGFSWVLNKTAILLEKNAALFSDKLIAVANLVKQEFLDVNICPPEKIETIYSGIDFRMFDISVDLEAKKRELRITPDEQVVGTVGHLVERKGHIYLIEAAQQVLGKTPNVKFIIAGEGPYRPEIEKKIAECNLNHKVILLGDRNDVPELLSIMDIYVQPSLAEGLGRSMTEALYMKLPVIATAVNAVPELIEHEKTGLLIPPKEPQAIADAIQDLLSHPEKRKQLGENAHRRVFPDFSADLMVDRIENLYLRLLAKKLPEKYSAAVQ